jgi:hypothetical protein
VDYNSRILAAASASGQNQAFASAKFANMLVDPYSTAGIAVYGDTVVIVGRFSDPVGIPANLCYSTDGGTTWVSKQLLDSLNVPYSFTAVIVNTTGQFFALSGKSVVTSTNGTLWSLATTIPGFFSAYDIIQFFPNATYPYVAFGFGMTATSEDGITWTSRFSGPGADSAVYGDGVYILLGGSGISRTTDFGLYTTPTLNEVAGTYTFTGGVYKNSTFILSARATGLTTNLSCGFKSVDAGVNFSLINTDVGYYENVNNGLLLNVPDSRSQTSGTEGLTGTVIANPNRGAALSFSGTTYSLRARQGTVITTTTGSPSTTGLSAFGGNVYDSYATTTPFNAGLATVSLAYSAGSWRITHTGSTGSSTIVVTAPNFNVNVINAYVASGAAITGYPFRVNDYFFVLFPNATTIFGGTEFNSSTIYASDVLTSWAQINTLPVAFNASSGTPGFAASYNLSILRGEFGAGGYSFMLNYSNNAIKRWMVGTAFTIPTALSANFSRNGLSDVKGSANDGTGTNGWVGYVVSFNPSGSNLFAQLQISNNFVSVPGLSTNISLTGLDGSNVQIANVTDVAFINSQFRVYCKFNNLLGELVPGVISVTTAGVQTQTVISGFENIKLLGRANSTLYVMNTGTGEVLSSTTGTAYTSRFTWNQPFIGKPVYEDAAGIVYTSGRLITTVEGVGGATNWYTSTNGSTWTKTEVTTPNAATLAVRGVYPNKYVRATSGNFVAIAQGFNELGSGFLSVATSGSLSNMPYKRLVPYAVPGFIPSPVFYNATLSEYCSISAYYGASVTSPDGLAWTLNSGNFDVNTSTVVNVPASADYAYYTYAAPANLFYRFNSDARYFAADPGTPTTYSLFSFPTIGTAYTGNRISNIGFDGTTYMTVYYNAGTLNSFTSTTGAIWSAAGNGTLTNVQPSLISSVTGSFLVYGSFTSANGAFTSNTGSTWTSSVNFNFTVAPAGTNTFVYVQAAYGNNTYVMAGYVIGTTAGPTIRNYRRVSTSSNGTTWTNVYAPTSFNETFTAITFTNLGSGFFIAGGDGGTRIMYSDAAGATWTNATISGTFTGSVLEIIDGGASASPRFVAVTSVINTVLTSNDGVNWTVVTLDADVDPGYVSFLNGRWVLASGNNTSNDLLRCAILTSG